MSSLFHSIRDACADLSIAMLFLSYLCEASKVNAYASMALVQAKRKFFLMSLLTRLHVTPYARPSHPRSFTHRTP